MLHQTQIYYQSILQMTKFVPDRNRTNRSCPAKFTEQLQVVHHVPLQYWRTATNSVIQKFVKKNCNKQLIKHKKQISQKGNA